MTMARLGRRMTFGIASLGLLWSAGTPQISALSPAASTTVNGLSLNIGVTNKGPLSSCDSPTVSPCPLATTTQFFLYVHNSNPAANFIGPPTPDRTNIPNAYVLSSYDMSITVNGSPLPGGSSSLTPPPNANFPAQSGRWPSTVTCSPTTGPPPCTTIESPAILPGETTAAAFIGWTHGSKEPNGSYVFTFVLHGTLNGQPIDLTASSPTIAMKTAAAPGWATASPMPTERAYLAAATGPDGRIYAIGGDNSGTLNTVEAYTPSTNSWATVASMSTARTLLAAATGPDGRIYAIAGYNSGTILNTVEAYTPSTNTWATVTSMPSARYGIAAATGSDGHVYAMGGQTDLTTTEAYTRSTNSWATLAPMSNGRYTPAAATGPDGLVYVMGGDLNYTALSAVEAYTASTNNWATAPSMPTGRRGLAAATGHDGRIYAIGGTTGDGHTPTTVNTVEAYTPVIITETPIPTAGSMPNDITVGSDGALWFTEYGAGKIGRITTAGSITEFALPPPASSSSACFGGPGPANGPDYIRTGNDSALWFTESNANKIGRITTAGQITEFAVPTAGAFPLGIAAGPDGALWFTEPCTDKIGRITTTGSLTEFTTPSSGSHPNSITAGPDGALWFTEMNTGKIGRASTSGSITEFDVSSVFLNPVKIASGPDGALWFGGAGVSALGRLTTTGNLTSYPIANQANGITTGRDGALWFAEGPGNRIGRLTTDGSYSDFLLTTPSSGPQNPTTGPDGAIWFVEFNANNVGHLRW